MINRNRTTETEEQRAQARQRQLQAREELAAAQEATGAAMRQQATRIAEQKQNPDFVETFADADVDSERWNWIENELAPQFSQAHIFGNRRPEWETKVDLLTPNRVQREITRHSPGRILRENPAINAAMQDAQWNPDEGLRADPEAIHPYSSADREALRDSGEVIATRKTLAIDGKGTDAVATVSTEHKTVRDEESEENSTAAKIAGGFR